MSYVALRTAAIRNTSLSEEGLIVQTVTTAYFDNREQSLSLFGAKEALIGDIRELASDCSEPDWDGAGAQPISPEAVAQAELFVHALPDDIQLPEISPEPDGEISLDWVRAQRIQFSVSVGASDRLAVAWLDGTNSGSWVERFHGTSIPRRILDGIRAVVGSNASVRAA